MSILIQLQELLDYSDHERTKWRDWIAADTSRIALPFQAGGRFPTVGSLLDHIFLVERRHLSRLEGATPPETTGVAAADWKALFEYADLVRADLRKYVAECDAAEAEQPVTAITRAGTQTMKKRRLATHIVLHEVRHLAQIAYAVHNAGHPPPGEHDLFYCPER